MIPLVALLFAAAQEPSPRPAAEQRAAPVLPADSRPDPRLLFELRADLRPGAIPLLVPRRATPLHRPFSIESIDPIRATNQAPFDVRVRGLGLARLDSAFLLAVDGAVQPVPLGSTLVAADEVVLHAPAGAADGLHYLVLVPRGASGAIWFSAFFVDPPLPRVRRLTPGSAPADVPTPLRMDGRYLEPATDVALEGPGDAVVPLDSFSQVSDIRIDGVVPAGLEPGDWTVRVVTPGGVSVVTERFRVDPPTYPPPAVRSVSELEVTNGVDRVVTLVGEHLLGADAVLARGNVELALPHAVLDASTVRAALPAGAPPDLYDLIVRSPAGESSPGPAKLLVRDPATELDLAGDGSVVAVDAHTVRLRSQHLFAVVDGGRLAWLHDRGLDRSPIARDGSTPGELGLEWDAQTPSALVGQPGTVLAQVVGNTTARGADFVFEHTGEELFRLTWGLDPTGKALRLQVSYDADRAGLPGNVLRVHLGAIGVRAGLRHLAAAHGGAVLGWHALARPRTLAHPDHYDHPLVFLEDPAGGGLLIDLSALGDQGGLRTHHRRGTAPRATRIELRATPSRDRLLAATLGPIVLEPSAGNWVEAVEPLQSTVDNAERPAWADSITGVFRVIGLNRFSDPAFDASDVQAPHLRVAADYAAPDPGDWRLLHVIEAHEEGLAGVPAWTLSPHFHALAGELHDEGWRVVPYLATPGLQSEHPEFSALRRFRLGRWDKGLQGTVWRFWDADGSGACCDDPEDYWLVNVAHAPYRQLLLDQVVAGRAATFPFDGVYFDFMKPNVRRDDRNDLNGDACAGYRSLVAEFRAGIDPAELLVAAEGSATFLTGAGNTLAAIHVAEPGRIEREPLGPGAPLAFPHPIGTHLVADWSLLMNASDQGVPAWHPIQHHLSRWMDLVQGALPAGGAIGFYGWRHVSFHPSSVRALEQIAEEGLHRRVHGVRPFTDPHPLWNDPQTLRLYEVDGVVQARTRDWAVRKSICDLFWHFGGRAPSASELADFAGRTGCNVLGLAAAACEVRERFQREPTPDGSVQSRAEALADVLAVFPAYPAP